MPLTEKMSIPNTEYMRKALKLALRAKGQTSPNPLVGAIIVKHGKIISQGWHRYCGGDHAEIMALKQAGEASRAAQLYVTLEPCSHFGRTPPCVDKIIAMGIKEVFVGMLDPNPLHNGKSIQKLRRAQIKVQVGFLEEELKQINETFIKYITQKLPFVVAKSAQTLDGKIALSNGDSKWITSPESRDYTHRLRCEFDSILVGINTILKDNPYLNSANKKRPMRKIIVDSHLRLSLNSNVFKDTDPQNIWVATTQTTREKKFKELRKIGVTLIVCPQWQKTGVPRESPQKLQLFSLCQELARRDITSVLIEGGATIIGGALQEKLIDKFLIFVSPKIMGDQNGLSSVEGLKVKRIDELVCLHRLNIKRIGEDILLEGYVNRAP